MCRTAAPAERRAFTLVELLVVIGIIGVLMALTLPAIQASRESGRRTQCANNVRQLSLAVANHESTRKSFPAGALYYWKASWLISILPYIEETTIARKLNYSEGPHPFWNTNSNTAPNNYAILTDYAPAFLFCPTSSLPRFTDWAPRRIATTNYVGISGAVTSATDFTDPTGGKRCSAGKYGYSCANGTLIPNKSIPAAKIHDGLSKTLIIGEQSDWLANTAGSVDRRSSSYHGAWIGAGSPGWPENGVWNDSSTEARYYNCATLRYSIGQKIDAGPGTAGMEDVWGATNMPIQSAHSGVTCVGRCDGSVDFLSEETAWDIQRYLAIRDDGQ
jgi:prepilin-type N-terminal cleavage/methylation domain-containing protein